MLFPVKGPQPVSHMVGWCDELAAENSVVVISKCFYSDKVIKSVEACVSLLSLKICRISH